MKEYHYTMIALAIVLILSALVYFHVIPVSRRAEDVLLGAKIEQAKIRTPTVEEYAARLRKENDSVHIYAVSNKFEVWCDSGIALMGKWKNAETIEEARKIVSDYYDEWARNCIGPIPPGKLVE